MALKHQTLRQAREAKGWTQEQLAAASGINQRNISKIETGGTEDPQNSTVIALETAMDLERGTLVFGRDCEAIAS